MEVDREEFFLAFASLELPFTEYNLDSVQAQTEWAEDIMIATADFILKKKTSQLKLLNNGHIQVDTHVLQRLVDEQLLVRT